MSDTKLRELERRWKETGAVEDEAAYLLERVRVGSETTLTWREYDLIRQRSTSAAATCLSSLLARQILTRADLEFAVWLRHEAACVALGKSGPDSSLPFTTWSKQFAHWGRRALVAVSLAAAQSVLPLWEQREEDGRPRSALEATERWLSCPCDAHADQALHCAYDAPHWTGGRARHDTTYSAAGAAYEAAHAVAAENERAAASHARAALDMSARASSTEAVRAAVDSGALHHALRLIS